MTALPSMRCICGHWDTEHAAFIEKVTPGRTRTLCDRCDCRYWMTPEHQAEIERERRQKRDIARSRFATSIEEPRA